MAPFSRLTRVALFVTCARVPSAHALTVIPGISPAGFVMAGGRPAIVTVSTTHPVGLPSVTNINFLRAVDAGGTAWGAPVTALTGSYTPWNMTLKMVAGKPAVCFLDGNRLNPVFVRASDAEGSAWPAPAGTYFTASFQDSSSAQVIMEEVNGVPAICFGANRLGVLFSRATNEDGSSWGPLVSLQTGSTDVSTINFTGFDMETVQGNPAVVYNINGSVIYRRALDPAGTAWGAKMSLFPSASASYAAGRMVMKVIHDHPVVAFESASGLMVARAADTTGAVWDAPFKVAGLPQGGGLNLKLEVINGKPAFGYEDPAASGSSIRYLEAIDSDGATAAAYATHLGHAATFVSYDVLQRRLLDMGHTVKCVRNVTDVDDPLFARARQLGVHYLDLAAGEEARFERDMVALNVLPVASTPRASSAIPDIRGFIGMVLDRGYAYESGGAVYFDVSRFEGFGSISQYTRDEMIEIARERGGDVDNPDKRDSLDFVLWQPSAPDEPAWETMWGPGRPGWHIECSALALRELGTTIDLHGGGTDLIYPHHECERAQSEAATGEPFVRHWMHTAMIQKDGAKMSKSLGNLVFVDKLRETWDPRAIRLAIVEHHYRTPWEWDDEIMPRAAARLDRWLGSAGPGGEHGSALREVRAVLDDDLDTPTAVAAIDDAAARGEGVREAAGLLGIDLP